MKVKVTYWGNKAEVFLAVKGAPIYFKYGETKELDLPDNIQLMKCFNVAPVESRPAVPAAELGASAQKEPSPPAKVVHRRTTRGKSRRSKGVE